MKKLLLSVAVSGLLTAPVNAGNLHVEVFDNGTPVTSGSSTIGTLTVLGSDTYFSQIQVTADGAGILPLGDLSTDTLQASTSSGFSGTHVLTVEVFQTNIAASGHVSWTGTANALVGTPGPIAESQYTGGTLSTLGTQFDGTQTFAAGVTNGSFGPIEGTLGFFNADAQKYVVSFNAASESFSGTQQFQTTIPEPSTWAMMLVGMIGLAAGVGFRKRLRLYA